LNGIVTAKGDPDMEPITYPTPGALRLFLEIPAGTIEVSSSETSETVLTIEGERDPDDFKVRFEPGSGQEHRLHVEYRGRKLGLRGRDLHVDVRVPFACEIEASTGSADLRVRGRVRSITFRTGSGDLRFDEVDADIEVKTASGDVQGSEAGGDVVAHSASGDLHVSRVVGRLVVRTASGDIGVDHLDGGASITTVSGDVRIVSLAVGEIAVRSVSGDVELGVAAGARVYMDLNTTSGDASSDLEIGQGDGDTDVDLTLRVASVSGDIRVRRAAAREARIA
jgi:DUF4097 and DUF4098 domain-containing protein YvlB